MALFIAYLASTTTYIGTSSLKCHTPPHTLQQQNKIKKKVYFYLRYLPLSCAFVTKAQQPLRLFPHSFILHTRFTYMDIQNVSKIVDCTLMLEIRHNSAQHSNIPQFLQRNKIKRNILNVSYYGVRFFICILRLLLYLFSWHFACCSLSLFVVIFICCHSVLILSSSFSFSSILNVSRVQYFLSFILIFTLTLCSLLSLARLFYYMAVGMLAAVVIVYVVAVVYARSFAYKIQHYLKVVLLYVRCDSL